MATFVPSTRLSSTAATSKSTELAPMGIVTDAGTVASLVSSLANVTTSAAATLDAGTPGELTLEITRDAKLAETVRPALSAHRNAIEELMAAVGSEEPALDGEILSATFQGFGLKWIRHPDEPEFEMRLRAAVRRLLAKLRLRRAAYRRAVLYT